MSEINISARQQIPPTEGSTNRGYENAFTGSDLPPITVTLESINKIIMEYFQNVIKPTVKENDQNREVPIIYGTPERWATIRKDGALRDSANDKLLAPIIVLKRINEQRGVLTNPVNKYVHTMLDGGWNNRNAYDRFAVQNNIRPSRKMRTVIIPDYIDLTYRVILWTEYQEQMDTLIEQINVEVDEYWGHRNNWKFRISVEEYEDQSELPTNEDRVVRKLFNMIVKAYLVPERMVKNFKLSSTNALSYTTKKIVTFIETVNDINKVKIQNP